jgi:hypothetical protein
MTDDITQVPDVHLLASLYVIQITKRSVDDGKARFISCARLRSSSKGYGRTDAERPHLTRQIVPDLGSEKYLL